MAVSYRKLWHLILDKKMSKSALERQSGISHHMLLKLNRDEDVSTEVLTKICAALNCEVQDIVDFFPDNETVNKQED